MEEEGGEGVERRSVRLEPREGKRGDNANGSTVARLARAGNFTGLPEV